MNLSEKTLEKLRELINEETEYRSGPKLVHFFNQLGFQDSYGEGFPSRWMFTDDRLGKINGTPQLDQCLKRVFAPINFVGRVEELDSLIGNFNQYLAFDKWQVVREDAEITFRKQNTVTVKAPEPEQEEDTFLNREFSQLNLGSLGLEAAVTQALLYRVDEIEKCFKGEAPLAVILLAGSTLEGLLLGLATQLPSKFNTSTSSPKDSLGKVKPFHAWTLANLIDVARDIGLIESDVQKFSHALRDFRNYIHPFEQVSSGFSPSMHTAKISLQVLKVAIVQAGANRVKTGV